MVHIVSEVPCEQGGNKRADSAESVYNKRRMVRTAFIGVEINLEIRIELFLYHETGLEIQVVQIETGVIMYRSRNIVGASRPKGEFVGLADEGIVLQGQIFLSREGKVAVPITQVLIHHVSCNICRVRRFFDEHAGSCLFRIAAGHIQVNGTFYIQELTPVLCFPPVGHRNLVAPYKGDGSFWSSKLAAVDHLQHGFCNYIAHRHTGSVVMGSGFIDMSGYIDPFLRLDRSLDFRNQHSLRLLFVCTESAYGHIDRTVGKQLQHGFKLVKGKVEGNRNTRRGITAHTSIRNVVCVPTLPVDYRHVVVRRVGDPGQDSKSAYIVGVVAGGISGGCCEKYFTGKFLRRDSLGVAVRCYRSHIDNFADLRSGLYIFFRCLIGVSNRGERSICR